MAAGAVERRAARVLGRGARRAAAAPLLPGARPAAGGSSCPSARTLLRISIASGLLRLRCGLASRGEIDSSGCVRAVWTRGDEWEEGSVQRGRRPWGLPRERRRAGACVRAGLPRAAAAAHLHYAEDLAGGGHRRLHALGVAGLARRHEHGCVLQGGQQLVPAVRLFEKLVEHLDGGGDRRGQRDGAEWGGSPSRTRFHSLCGASIGPRAFRCVL